MHCILIKYKVLFLQSSYISKIFTRTFSVIGPQFDNDKNYQNNIFLILLNLKEVDVCPALKRPLRVTTKSITRTQITM